MDSPNIVFARTRMISKIDVGMIGRMSAGGGYGGRSCTCVSTGQDGTHGIGCGSPEMMKGPRQSSIP